MNFNLYQFKDSDLPKRGELLQLMLINSYTKEQIFAFYGEELDHDKPTILYFIASGGFEYIERIYPDSYGLCIETDAGLFYQIINTWKGQELKIQIIK